MLDLAKHIVNQKTSRFEPEKFEDHYEAALTELINQKRNGKPIAAKARPKGENVVDLMDALKRSIANDRGVESSSSTIASTSSTKHQRWPATFYDDVLKSESWQQAGRLCR